MTLLKKIPVRNKDFRMGVKRSFDSPVKGERKRTRRSTGVGNSSTRTLVFEEC